MPLAQAAFSFLSLPAEARSAKAGSQALESSVFEALSAKAGFYRTNRVAFVFAYLECGHRFF
jgi:hypothetical protein